MSPEAEWSVQGSTATSFPGITLSFPSAEALDLGGRAFSADRSTHRLQSLVEQLHKNVPSRALDIVGGATALGHEVRHFHDLLLSPLGNAAFRLRIVAAANAWQLSQHLTDADGAIPVPLTTWHRLAEERKKRIRGQWANRGIATHPLAERVGDYTEVLNSVSQAYAGIGNLFRPPRSEQPEVDPRHILEASALLVQLQSAWNVYGAAETSLFLEQLCGDPGLPKRYQALRPLAQMYRSQQLPFDLEFVGALTTWCLLGDYQRDSWNACPARRFLAAFGHLLKAGLPSIGTRSGAHLAKLSSALNAPPVEETLRAELERTAQECVRRQKNLPSSVRELLGPVLQSMQQRTDALRLMIGLLENAGTYASPSQYLELAGKWVAAPIRFRFCGWGIPEDDTPELTELFESTYTARHEGRTLVVGGVLKGQTDGVTVFSPSVSHMALGQFALSDLLFAEFDRDNPDLELARAMLQAQGIVSWEIMD
jgi:hypothetical protein